MSIQAILLPMFVQVGLTFVLLFWMQALRLRVIRAGQVDPQQVRLREPNWPPRVTQIANAFHNQLELPVLFYVVVLLALVTETLDSVLDRFSQRVKRSYRTVEETDQLKAERIDYTASSTMSLHGENALVTAEQLVKVDGEQIHLG